MGNVLEVISAKVEIYFDGFWYNRGIFIEIQARKCFMGVLRGWGVYGNFSSDAMFFIAMGDQQHGIWREGQYFFF